MKFFNILKKITPLLIKSKIKLAISYIKGHRDSDILMAQTLTILKMEHQFVPPPPKHLQVRVVGGYSPEFIESGFDTCQSFNEILNKTIGKELSDFSKIYDFGCGCGRVVRALKTLNPSVVCHGSDIDAEAISWLQQNYSKFAEFSVNPSATRTIHPDNHFDFVYSISVFTHLPEDMQFFWLSELQRIVKPNGFLLLTTHGEKHYREFTSVMKDKGFFYNNPKFGYNYGKSIGLPDFYQNSYHSHDYIRKEWSRYFIIKDILTLGLDNHQDVVILQKFDK
jgi:2-polyprenyl-3-methyl-5-hydroxy-6-metoxy-1,4-benzoquinol methylase